MLTLHQFAPMWGLPNASPFCLKLETYLRLAGIPYRTALVGDPADGPKGKAPFIETEAGWRLGDSTLIVRHLEETRGVDLDAHLTPTERAVAHALTVMLEERLYFAVEHGQWADDTFWPLLRDAYFNDLPEPIRAEVADEARQQVRQALHAQGIGRHTPEEILALATADIDALATILGGRPYLGGDRPCTADATAFGFMANLLLPPMATPYQAAVATHGNLVTYVARMMERVFPEYASRLKAA